MGACGCVCMGRELVSVVKPPHLSAAAVLLLLQQLLGGSVVVNLGGLQVVRGQRLGNLGR